MLSCVKAKCLCTFAVMFVEILLGTQETGAFTQTSAFYVFLNFFQQTGNDRLKIISDRQRNSVCSVQDECLLQQELHERAVMLFRSLLQYVTDFLVWEENSELSAELQPRYGLSWSTHGSESLKKKKSLQSA